MRPSAEEGVALREQANWWTGRTAGVCWLALGTVVVHVAVGGRYGFNRDELMALEDARHLAWGYVQYPPMTAFFGWVALHLFGTSLVGFRFFAALAQALAVILTGLMAKELGGGKWSMAVAALAGVPFCLGAGALMQYISFDYVCWVLVEYGMVRVLRGDGASNEWRATKAADPMSTVPSELRASKNGGATDEGPGQKELADGLSSELGANRRPPLQWQESEWWVAVAAGIGLGMLAKYTIGVLVVGVVAGVLFTSARRHLRSAWLWLGVLVAVVIWLPNVVWEWERNFVSAEFLRFLHERDVTTGVTDGFFAGQLELTMLAAPLALAGLWFYFFSEEGRAYRAMGWMYAVPLVLLVVLKGRDYYLAPAYPMLYAAGAVWAERSMEAVKSGTNPSPLSANQRPGISDQEERPLASQTTLGMTWLGKWGSVVKRVVWVALCLDVVAAAAVALPIAPVNSSWWKFAANVDLALPEEIGWEEFVQGVAGVWKGLPEGERVRAGILAGNYGEMGALNLYRERYGLPRAISGVNSSWERGYGVPAPETVVVVGYAREFLEKHFTSCEVKGRTRNRYGVANEETAEDPDIFVCRGLREDWETFWVAAKKFA